jgi:molybdate transport system ATP-binding protein
MQGSTEEILQPEKISEIFGDGGLREEGQGSISGSKKCSLLVPQELITMRTRRCGMAGRLSWTILTGLFEEENWVLGPNGSRQIKTPELITGDNVQGYANDIYLFGRERSGGIWEIKEKLSMVSAGIPDEISETHPPLMR